MIKSKEDSINIIKKEEIKDEFKNEINEEIENECKEEIKEELESNIRNTLKRKYDEDEITLLDGLIKNENVKKHKKVKTVDKILQMEQEKV
jgi:hypothetical protein